MIESRPNYGIDSCEFQLRGRPRREVTVIPPTRIDELSSMVTLGLTFSHRTAGPGRVEQCALRETARGEELMPRHSQHQPTTRTPVCEAELRCHSLESETLWTRKGAFTGAFAQKIGRFEMADKGTLFLDEIGDIPLALQPTSV